MTRFEGVEHRGDAALVAVQRGLGGHLRDRGGVGGGLRLHVGHGAQDRFGAGRVANAPAGHRIGLGDAVQHQRAVIQIGADIENVDEGHIIQTDVFVHVVRSNQHLRVLAQHCAQGRQFVAGVNRAGGVGRAVDNEQFSLRGDRRFQLRRGDLEALLDTRFDDDRLAICQNHDIRIRHPVRRGDDDFVAWIDDRLRQVEKALLAAARDQNLFGRVVETVVAF